MPMFRIVEWKDLKTSEKKKALLQFPEEARSSAVLLLNRNIRAIKMLSKISGRPKISHVHLSHNCFCFFNNGNPKAILMVRQNKNNVVIMFASVDEKFETDFFKLTSRLARVGRTPLEELFYKAVRSGVENNCTHIRLNLMFTKKSGLDHLLEVMTRAVYNGIIQSGSTGKIDTVKFPRRLDLYKLEQKVISLKKKPNKLRKKPLPRIQRRRK